MTSRNINDDNTLAYLFDKKAYPVGAIFFTASKEDPAKTVGGKWKKRSDFTLPSGISAWERTA